MKKMNINAQKETNGGKVCGYCGASYWAIFEWFHTLCCNRKKQRDSILNY